MLERCAEWYRKHGPVYDLKMPPYRFQDPAFGSGSAGGESTMQGTTPKPQISAEKTGESTAQSTTLSPEVEAALGRIERVIDGIDMDDVRFDLHDGREIRAADLRLLIEAVRS